MSEIDTFVLSDGTVVTLSELATPKTSPKRREYIAAADMEAGNEYRFAVKGIHSDNAIPHLVTAMSADDDGEVTVEYRATWIDGESGRRTVGVAKSAPFSAIEQVSRFTSK